VTKVLVTGATGQDAYYLMPKLAHLGYEVYGTVRGGDPARLKYLAEIPFLSLIQADLLDYPSLISVATAVHPDIIINTAGVTSPPQCWGTPELACQVNGVGALRLLEIYSDPQIRYIQFGSIAEFGPYGAAKKYAEIMMDDWRERGFPTTTIKFAGHHSPRRSPMFFSRKVTQAVALIKANLQDKLFLGDLTRYQDWGCADEFMDAVIEILALAPGTYTVGTDTTYSLQEFVDLAFSTVGLDWREHVETIPGGVQPVDVPVLSAKTDPELLWKPTRTFEQLIQWMVEADMELLRG
jgi:GDPmannose 4,6-dehydratase